MSNLVNDFNDYRQRVNEVILSKNNLVMKRLWNLDTNTYENGVLHKKTKDILGFVASMVLRCDDCIKYHLGNSLNWAYIEMKCTRFSPLPIFLEVPLLYPIQEELPNIGKHLTASQKIIPNN